MTVQPALRRARIALKHFADFLATPATVIFALLAIATGCAVTGVFMLAGTAWAFIASSVILFALAVLLLRGVSGV